jgi:hypothetical protein
VVLEGRNLVHYVRDNTDPALTWTFDGIITQQATGPAGFIQSNFGAGEHRNFEVVAPEGDVLAFYWRDNSAPGRPWRPGGRVTAGAGPINAATLLQSGLDNNLEVLSQECDNSVFHYHRYWTGSDYQWWRGSCIKIDEGPYAAERGRPMSKKIVQLTGQHDKQRSTFAYNRTEESFGIRGTDLGAAFEHGGCTYFLFGDTHRTFSTPPLADAIAYSTFPDASSGLPLQFHLSYPEVVNPSVDQREYDVPVDGFSFASQMFVFFTTDHFRNRKVMGRSVLTRCTEPESDFEHSRFDTPLRFQYLAEFSSQKFINVSVQRVGQDIIREYRLPAAHEGLLIWGTGGYRADNVYLAFLPLDDEQRVTHLFRSDVLQWARRSDRACGVYARQPNPLGTILQALAGAGLVARWARASD